MVADIDPPAVEVHADVMGGTPVFAGSRLPVATVLASLDGGAPWEQLHLSWPWLTTAHVDAARAYAAKNDIGVRPWLSKVGDDDSLYRQSGSP